MHEPPLTRPDSPTETTFAMLMEMLRWRALNQADQKAYTFLCQMESKNIEASIVKDRPEEKPHHEGIQRKRKREHSKRMKSVVAYVA